MLPPELLVIVAPDELAKSIALVLSEEETVPELLTVKPSEALP